jgi:transcriptional regulator with XRE-family HTH domain
MSQIAQRLKDARSEAGLTQEALARDAGLSLPTVQRSEVGRHEPSVSTLRCLAAALGCSVADLIGEEASAS